MLYITRYLLFTLLSLSITSLTLAQDGAESSQVTALDCDDNNSIANLRGDCSDMTEISKPVVIIDVRNKSDEESAKIIYDAVKLIAKDSSYSARANELLKAEKNIRVLHDETEGSHATLLVAAGLHSLVERPDLKKHIVAGAVSAEVGSLAFKKFIASSLPEKNRNMASRIAGLVTACFVGVAKEAYDSRKPAKHTVDAKDALATCGGGAGILLKTEFKF